MEKFSSELELIEMKQSGLNKAFETLNSQASSVLLLTLQWKDLEEHLDSTRKSIETRFKELEVHEKEMVLKEEQLGLVKRELGEKETELGLVLEKIRLNKKQMVFMQKSMEQLESKKQELGSVESSLKECCDELRLKEVQLEMVKNWVVKYRDEVMVKGKEVKLAKKRLEDCVEAFVLKKKELCGVQKLIEERTMELKLKEQHVESIKVLIEENSEELEVKEKQYDKIGRLINERTMELKVKEKEVESIDGCIKERSEEIKSKKKILDSIEKKLKDAEPKWKQLEELEVKEKQYDEMGRLINEQTVELKLKEKEVKSIDGCIKEKSEEIKSKKKVLDFIEKKLKEAESKGKQLDSIERLYKKYCEDVELKEREYNGICRSIEEHKEELESKVIQLNSTQNLIKECDKELKSKAEELCSIQKAIVGCSKEQKSKEKELDLVEESIKECTDALESKEKQLKFVQETANERLKELELEGKHLDSLRKSIEERSHNLEMRERQVEEQLKELDLKEKQVDSIQISLKVAMEEKGKNNSLPAQVKIEQPESTPANNAIVAPYPASLRPCVTMGGQSLQLLLNKHLQRHEIVRAEVSTILQTSSDPSMLVLDAMHGFYPPHSREEDMVFDVNIIRRSCILLLEQLMKTSPVVEPQVREEAMKLAVEWKAKMKVADDNCLEVLGFLQLLASYGLGSGFNEDELRRLLATIDQHRQAPELCRTLGIIDKAPVASTLHSQVKMELSEDLPAKNVTHSSSSSLKLQLSATTYGSLQFLNGQLNGPDVMGNEILSSLQMSLNPAKLVLNVMQGSFPHIWEKGDTGFEAGVMKNYILMLEHLKRVSPQIHPQIKEEAIKLAVEWKVKLTASTTNSLEVLAFLQLLATYELSSSFNGDEILKLFEVVAEYKQALEVCQSLGFLDQIPDFIKNLIERKLYIKAVRFICAFKLADKFPPVPLLKEYLENSRIFTKRSCKKKKSIEEKDKAANRELAALGAVLGCITDYNLESQFPPKVIEKRVLEIEKVKAERRHAGPASAVSVEPKQPVLKKRGNSDSAHKQQLQQQNKKKRARTAVSTVRPYARPVFTPPISSYRYGTSAVSNGGHEQYGFDGNFRVAPNLGAGQQFYRNPYMYHYSL